MKRLKIMIKTLSETILTANRNSLMTTSENSVSGGIMRGIFAKKYIEKHNLGDKAHKDANFAKFFLGGLRFMVARPVKHGLRAVMVPRSVQASKDGKFYNDMLVCPNPEDYEKGYKTKKGQAVIDENGRIDYVNVSKNTTLHIKRSDEKNRLSGSSRDGGVFTYEFVEAGEVFCGYCLGDDETIDAFVDEYRDVDTDCHIGRSQNTQYGHCSIEIEKAEKIPPISANSGKIFARLETPLIMPEPIIDARKTLAEIFKEIDSSFDIGVIMGAQEEMYGYSGVWNLKHPAQYALASGTVFELKFGEEPKGEELSDLFYGGVGLRLEEGFGQLRPWKADNSIKPWQSDTKPESEETAEKIIYEVKHPEVKRATKIIVEKRIEHRVKMKAYDDVQKIGSELKGKAHAFATLESLLGARKNLETIQKRMETSLVNVKSKQFQTHLQNIKIDGTELIEKITGTTDYTADLPQILQDFALKTHIATVKDGKTTFDKEIIGAAYYDYWLWFFRHGRKAAQAEQRRG